MVLEGKKLTDIKNHVLVLIHAKYCRNGECKQSHCVDFRDVQEHIKNCHDPEMICDKKHCVQSQQYIRYSVFPNVSHVFRQRTRF